MNINVIRLLIINFLVDFDKQTKDNLLNKPIWQIDESIKSFKPYELNEILKLPKEDKIKWLTENNLHPYRQFAIKVKNKIENKLGLDTIIKTVNDMCNGKFLDSIGVPGHSLYSDIIMKLCDNLYKEKNTSS